MKKSLTVTVNDGSDVVRKKNQWMLRITEYADRLIDDLDQVDYVER